MKESPVFPGFDYDNNENSSYEFDPRADFNQFLEEAKRYAKGKEAKVPEENGKKQQVLEGEKKSKKKSWKTALFSFWKKTEDNKKKNKQCPKEAQPISSNFANANAKPRGHVSGPIYRHGGAGASGKRQRPASGPLTNLFHSKKREENEIRIPYVSLDRLNREQYDAKDYGPVYSVP